MARSLLFLLWLVIAHAVSATTTHRDLLVHFDKDKSTLTAGAIRALDDLLDTVDLSGDYTFDVHGHTDSDGALAYNDALSQARAEAVRNYLVAHGVDAALVRMERSGEREPLVPNRDATTMAENRRVRVTFTRHAFANTEELRQALMEGTVQHFTIDPTKDQQITGAAGVRLATRAGAWVDEQGRPAMGPVDLELTEATGTQAMLAHRLSTHAGARILETGGMLKVAAHDASGAPLQLKASAPMQVSLPAQEQKPGMELFLSTDGADWQATGTPIVQRTVTTWVEPAYPDVAFPAWKQPYYRVPKGKPVEPVEPMEPQQPIAPRRESYMAAGPWWKFLFPRKAAAQAERRYASAMLRYGKQMEQYAKRMRTYTTACAAYPEQLEAYVPKRADWDERMVNDRVRWDSTVYAPAWAAYEARVAPLRVRYDSLMQDRARIRAASMQRYAVEADSTNTADINGLGAYVFTTARLGWINCDRFSGVPEEEKYAVVAKDHGPFDDEVFLVFTDIRSILAMGAVQGGERMSPPVPRDQPATLFAYAVIDGRAQVCMEPVVPGRKPEVHFRPSSFAEIQQLLGAFAPA